MKAAWRQKAWVQISALSLFLWAALDELFNLIHLGWGWGLGGPEAWNKTGTPSPRQAVITKHPAPKDQMSQYQSSKSPQQRTFSANRQ